MRNWLGRILKWHAPIRGVSVKYLSDEQIAEREERWRSEAAAAREEAFSGGQRLLLTDVGHLVVPDELAYLGVAFDGRLIIATSGADPAATFAGRDESPGFASFPHSMATEAYAMDIVFVDADGARERRFVDGVPVAHPFVQPAPSGDLLVVGSRARRMDGEGEHNAWLFAEDGTLRGSFCAGDGIQNVQVTPNGRVWLGYFDEGVFGNFGWGNPDSVQPLGRSGLVQWSLAGQRLWEFNPPAGHDVIVDCYAMCAAGQDIWACYYPDFPIVKVGPGLEVTAWSFGVRGAHTIAASGDTVVLVGGYRGLHDRAVFATTNGDGSVDQAVFQLVMPDGRDIPDHARVVARGPLVHVLVENRWMCLDLERQLRVS